MGVLEGLITGGDTQGDTTGHVLQFFFIDMIVAYHIDFADFPGQLNDFIQGGKQLEGGPLGFLDQFGDLQIDQSLFFFIGQSFKKIAALENLLEIVIAKGVFIGSR